MLKARERTETETKKIEKGEKKPHDHIGSFTNYTFDRENLIDDVSSMSENSELNFTSLAKKYHLKNLKGEEPKNGGQIIKGYLLSKKENINNINISVSHRVRRKKRK